MNWNHHPGVSCGVQTRTPPQQHLDRQEDLPDVTTPRRSHDFFSRAELFDSCQRIRIYLLEVKVRYGKIRFARYLM